MEKKYYVFNHGSYGSSSGRFAQKVVVLDDPLVVGEVVTEFVVQTQVKISFKNF